VTDTTYLLRFFQVVPPVPPLIVATFVAVTGVASLAVVTAPGRARGALAPVLLLQLFTASSGFAVPARRGHYDLLLTRGTSRLRVTLSHWATTIAPGVFSWLVLVCVERLAIGDGAVLLASGTWAAMIMVSTLPWAFTIALPRFSGGVGWLLFLVTMGTTFSEGVFAEWTVTSTRVEALVWPAWVFLIYPLCAVGESLGPPHLLAVAPGITLAAAAMVAACHWAAHSDVPLSAAQ
jgi:hypothetical protein